MDEPLLPVLLPSPPVAGTLIALQPASSVGYFQIVTANTAAFVTPQAPLAQSSFFGVTTQPTTHSAGVKPQ